MGEPAHLKPPPSSFFLLPSSFFLFPSCFVCCCRCFPFSASFAPLFCLVVWLALSFLFCFVVGIVSHPPPGLLVCLLFPTLVFGLHHQRMASFPVCSLLLLVPLPVPLLLELFLFNPSEQRH